GGSGRDHAHDREVEHALRHAGPRPSPERRGDRASGRRRMIEMLAQSFVRYAVIASVLAGGVSAYLGVYVLLRRIVFVGIAIAQIATLGVALGHMLGLHQAEAAFGLSL